MDCCFIKPGHLGHLGHFSHQDFCIICSQNFLRQSSRLNVIFFVFPGHSLLSNFQLRLVCHDACVMRLLRTKRRDSPSGRVQTGGHDDPTFVTNAKKNHGAFRHRRRRRGRSLIPTPNYATHTTLRARESIGALLMVLSANIVHMKRVP